VSEPELREIPDAAEVGYIYRTLLQRDFPREECKPLAVILDALQRGEYVCFGLYAEKLLAYAFFARVSREGGSDYLLDYFAVDRERRGEGVGSAFLRRLTGKFGPGDCVLLEAEDPEAAEDPEERARRERRLQFYRANGCAEADVRATVFGVPYAVLQLPAGALRPTAEVREIYTALYRRILSEHFFRTQFSL